MAGVTSMEGFVLIWAACAAIGYAIAKPKGKGSTGLVLGLLLGLIGIIIAAFLSDSPEVAMQKQRQQTYQGGSMHAPTPSPPSVLTGWHPDPYGRHQSRYFDGFKWTDHVASNGIQSVEHASI